MQPAEQIDYDVPPSTCGYPIFFSICGENQPLGKSDGLPQSFNSPSLTLPHPSYTPNIANVNMYNTLPVGFLNSNENIVIPQRDFNFNDLLKASQNPLMSNSGELYDVPKPHPRHMPFPPISATLASNIAKQEISTSKPDEIYPAELVITTDTSNEPQFQSNQQSTSTLPPLDTRLSSSFSSSSSSSLDKGVKENSNQFIPRKDNQGLSRNTLPRISSNQTGSQPLVHFGSTTSLPSPIPHLSGHEISNLDSNHNPANGTSFNDQAYDVPPTRNLTLVGIENGCCSNCGTLTSLRKVGFEAIDNIRNEQLNAFPTVNIRAKNGDRSKQDSIRPTSSWNSETNSDRSAKAMAAITRSYPSGINALPIDIPPDSQGLDLSLDRGLILANRLENESLETIDKLINLSSSSSWRERNYLSLKLVELKRCCTQLKCVTRELEVFTEGIYINSLRNPGSSINNKLHRLFRQLQDSARIVIHTIKAIESRGWDVDQLSLPAETGKRSHDEIDQLIACIPGLKEDIKHIMSLVKSHGNLLFPEKNERQISTLSNNQSQLNLSDSIGSVSSSSSSRSSSGALKTMPSKAPPPPVAPKPPINKRPLPLVPRDNQFTSDVNPIFGKTPLRGIGAKTADTKLGNEIDDDEVGDYASLETRDVINQPSFFNSISSLPSSGPNGGKLMRNQSSQDYPSDYPDPKLQQLLSHYSPLLEEQNQNLRNSVNALISAINTKQLPNVLISLSKLVIIAGQQMISIGDKIRCSDPGEVGSYAARCCNSLCDSLRNLINTTKKAANSFPSTADLQDLQDNIVQVSIHSDQLTLIGQQGI